MFQEGAVELWRLHQKYFLTIWLLTFIFSQLSKCSKNNTLILNDKTESIIRMKDPSAFKKIFNLK